MTRPIESAERTSTGPPMTGASPSASVVIGRVWTLIVWTVSGARGPLGSKSELSRWTLSVLSDEPVRRSGRVGCGTTRSVLTKSACAARTATSSPV